MKKEKIGVYDSGLGGVSVLKELVRQIPNVDFLYLSDSKNNPYGDKTKEEIKKIVFRNIEFLITQGCKVIVITCNTATAVAIDEVRLRYPEIIFIGTEPAIKMAYDQGKEKETLLLATKLTLECERIQGLIEKYPMKNLHTVACVGLADLIESKNLEKTKEYIEKHLSEYKKVDTVILGCTHYPLIREQFENFFEDAQIVEGSKGIARQTKRKLPFSTREEKGEVTFVDTSSNEEKEEIFKFYFNR